MRNDYLEQHEWCEACGGKSAMCVHHIKSRGSGGKDDDDNLLALCYECHTAIHSGGPSKFCAKYPQVYPKISKIKYKVKK